jgi:histidinol-phosphate aminotransferase
MTNKDWTMTRRDWLAASSLVLGGLACRPAPARAEAAARHLRARLSLNENPFGPSPAAIEAMRRELAEISRYGNAGADLLTRAVVAREAVPADQIVFGEILGALGYHLATTGPDGGEFIYSEPGYTALVNAVAPGGGVVIGIPLNQQLENDLPAIAAKVSARTRGIYLVNPHNPSGTVSDAGLFLSFVREMSKRTTIIVDEAYLEFEPDFAKRTAVSLTRAGENVIVFRTFAKLFGLAGLSVGYAVAPKAHAASLRRAGIGAPEALDRLAIAASTSSLQDTDYIAATRAKVVAERDKWNRLFDDLKLRHSDSRGNFVFFETGRPHQEFAAALRARGIEIGRSFPPLERWARISIGLPEENELAREAVAEVLP